MTIDQSNIHHVSQSVEAKGPVWALVDMSNQVTAACEQIDENTLVVVGAGGITKSPYQLTQVISTWPDVMRGSDHLQGNMLNERSDRAITPQDSGPTDSSSLL